MLKLNSQSRIVIAGGGLVGALLAVFLRQRHHSACVIEKRPDPRLGPTSGGRSINLAISQRGLTALDRVGLKTEALKLARPMAGRMMHAIDGKTQYQAYGQNPGDSIWSIPRHDLNCLLIDRGAQDSRIDWKFSTELKSCDWQNQKLQLNSNGRLEEISYDLLIGTDGAASAVRKDLLKFHSMTETVIDSEHAYKEIHMAPKSSGDFQMDPQALHIWPRGEFMMIALPNYDGSFTGTLFMPEKNSDVSFASLTTSESVRNFFTHYFKEWTDLVPDYTEQFFKNPTSGLKTLKVDRWSTANVVLMGDAAHAIVPFFGQGMNCGFEDVRVLFEEFWHDLDLHVSVDLVGFGMARKPEADAIAEMALENYIEMRSKVADQRFLLARRLEKELHERFPERYLSRYQMVSFTNMPYSEAYQRGLAQEQLLARLLTKVESIDGVDWGLAEQLVSSLPTMPLAKEIS